MFRTGAESAATKSAVQRSDALLGRILARLDQYDMTNTTNVLVMGDHGMTDHSSDKVIYLSDYGVGLGDMEWFTNTMFSSGMILPRESNSAQEVRLLQNSHHPVSEETTYKIIFCTVMMDFQVPWSYFNGLNALTEMATSGDPQ